MPRASSDSTDAIHELSSGRVEVLGLLPYSSNYVFLAEVAGADGATLCVYKPTRGERPLWDFPPGSLAAREVAAFVVSEAAGWRLVPPTVLRHDAPLGPGSIQVFIDHDPERHFFSLADERLDDFKVFAALDAVINNADRKAGHVIEDRDGRLWGVDHGLSFNVAPKLRTVIWTFAGDPLPADVVAALERVDRELACNRALRGALGALLGADEIDATRARTRRLLQTRRFPSPETSHHLPWPLV